MAGLRRSVVQPASRRPCASVRRTCAAPPPVRRRASKRTSPGQCLEETDAAPIQSFTILVAFWGTSCAPAGTARELESGSQAPLPPRRAPGTGENGRLLGGGEIAVKKRDAAASHQVKNNGRRTPPSEVNPFAVPGRRRPFLSHRLPALTPSCVPRVRIGWKGQVAST